MNWEQFRALETFAILYDIQIDEELYNRGPCRFLNADNDPVQLVDVLNGGETGGSLYNHRPWEAPPKWTLKKLERDARSQVKNIGLTNPQAAWPESLSSVIRNALPDGILTQAWESAPVRLRALLLAKFIRSELMRHGGTATESVLDELAEWLLKRMPPVPVLSPAGDVSSRELLDRHVGLLVRALSLIEASSCYHGYHQIAHAEEALNLLRKAFEAFEAFGLREDEHIGQSPYELVAMYNKAMGYMHIGHGHNWEQAAKNFQSVSRDCGLVNGNIPWNVYAFKPARDADAWLNCFRWEDGVELFRAYVGHASTVQMADALNKMQRSTEAVHCLNDLNTRSESEEYPETQYRHQLRLRVERRCRADQDRAPIKPLRLPPDLGGRQRIESQFDSLEAEALKRCPRHLPRVLTKRANAAISDREEFDQVLLEWATGLDGAAGALKNGLYNAEIAQNYLALRLPLGWKGVDTFFEAVLDLLEDRTNRTRRLEIARRTEHGLWKVWEGASNPEASPPNANLSEIRAVALEGLSNTAKGYYLHLAEILCRHHALEGPLTEYEVHVVKNRARRVNDRLLPSGRDSELKRKALNSFIWEQFVGLKSTRLERATRRMRCRLCGFSERWRQRRSDCTRPDGNDLCPPLGRAASSNPALILSHQPLDDDLVVVHYCDETVARNQGAIDTRLLEGNRPRTPSGWGLAILQRWNSFTPAAASSEGGGYLLTWFPPRECPRCKQSRGAAKYCPKCGQLLVESDLARAENFPHIGLTIDPGYGFVKNLLAQGYSITDLTAVAVTHDHPDHLADFEAMHNLLIEVKKLREKNKEEKVSIDLIVSLGALEHLQSVVDGSNVIRDTVVLEPVLSWETDGNAKPYPLGSHSLRTLHQGSQQMIKLTAKRAIHKDVSVFRSHKCDSLGLVADLTSDCGDKISVGLPSDTAWDDGIGDAYAGCDVVCVHIGSISERNHRLLELLNRGELDSVLVEANHLYLPGVVWFAERICADCLADREKLIVLSEFGEELSGGIRVMLAKALDSHFGKVRFLAGDVGLLVDPVHRSIRCSCCDSFYPWATTEFEHEVFGDNEQIFYVCPTCHDALSQDQRGAIFRKKQQPLMRMILG